MTPSTTYTGSACVVACDVSKQPPWSIATSTTTAPSFMPRIISRVTSFGATAPGISTAPITRSASSTDAATCRLELISSVTRPGEDLLEMAHPVDRALEDRHLRAEAERDDRRVVADDPAADDHDLAGSDTRHAAEQQAAAAERLLEEVRARLRGQPARHLRHRREQRQRPPDLDRLVRDRGDPARDQRARQRLVGRDVQVREEDQALAQPRGTRTRSAPSPSARAPSVSQTSSTDTIRAPTRSYASSGNAEPTPAPVSIDDLVPGADQLERAGRRQRDAVLVRLDLLGDADPHGARKRSSALTSGRRRRGRASRRPSPRDRRRRSARRTCGCRSSRSRGSRTAGRAR